MQSKIPVIRMKPSLLPDVLRAIAVTEGDRKKTDAKIYEIMIRESKRSKPPTFVAATRAVTYPTLRHLGLAFGDGDLIRLTASGDALNESLAGDREQFSMSLAVHLMNWDRSNIQLLNKIREISASGSPVTFGAIADQYWPNDKIAANDLKRLFPYYQAADLVTISPDGVSVNENQVETAKKLSTSSVSKENFVKTLLEEYFSEVRVRGSPAIPIPILERRVCRAFQYHLWPDSFRNTLASLPRESPDYLIHFSQPMEREGEGLRIGREYFYYIQIRRKMSP